MRFPFVVVPQVNDAQRARFARHMDSAASGWHRRFTESIWRRHQHPSNAALSGWTTPDDRRRRIVHFHDEYDLVGDAFVLRRAHLFLSVTLPSADVDAYEAAVADGLRAGGWSATADGAHRLGDLRARVAVHREHPEDARREYPTSPGYRSLDLTVDGGDYVSPPGWNDRPWRVFFDVGLRAKLRPETPTVVEPEALAAHLPAQVELGCGPSIEAGIPHLSNLHRIYGVSHADYGFVFRAADDALLGVLRDPAAKYREFTDIYRACLVAPSTPFYAALADLWRRGHLVGPVVTNNFDCQCAEVGLPEVSLRNYDSGPYYPTIAHDPRARSLLVIGVHADRRLVQMRARERGLRVLFVDPERYVAPDGRAIAYPVEAPQRGDLFVRAAAGEALPRLVTALGY
jgi:hypothetical protein